MTESPFKSVSKQEIKKRKKIYYNEIYPKMEKKWISDFKKRKDDIEKIEAFVEKDKASVGYFVLIDEGEYFKNHKNKEKNYNEIEWEDKDEKWAGYPFSIVRKEKKVNCL